MAWNLLCFLKYRLGAGENSMLFCVLASRCYNVLPRGSPTVPLMWDYHSSCGADGLPSWEISPAWHACFDGIGFGKYRRPGEEKMWQAVVWEMRCSASQPGKKEFGNLCNFQGYREGHTTFIKSVKQSLSWGKTGTCCLTNFQGLNARSGEERQNKGKLWLLTFLFRRSWNHMTGIE